ncbi:hypothetical protein evm_001158 [Chilo suppressalis]|nr:hypothetical protein evm_001158 [Chilo suppressalis]
MPDRERMRDARHAIRERSASVVFDLTVICHVCVVDKMATEKFIECVKRYPMLYNSRDKNFTNLEKKAETWEIIAREMNESSEGCRIKWKGLRDGYTKYKKHSKGDMGDNASHKQSYTNWCWAPHLQFLDNYAKRRKIIPSMSKTAAQYNSYSHSSVPDSDEWQDNDTSSTYAPSTPSASTSTTRTSQTVTKVTQSRTATATTSDDDVERILNFMRSKQKRPHTDAVDDLFQSYAKTFKRFSVQTQIMLKVNIAKLFADAELREHNSMNQNQPLFVTMDCDIKTEDNLNQDMESFDVTFDPNDDD